MKPAFGEKPALASPSKTEHRTHQTHPWRQEGQPGRGDKAYCGGKETWWGDLPGSYVLRRRWQDVERFHQALVSELAFDKERDCRRVKAKIPTLPNKADLDTFLQHCAATGDALALQRRTPLPREDSMRSVEDLDDLQWIYVEKRLKPYFEEVNRVLREVPTEVLLNSHALRHFVTGRGISGWSLSMTRKATPVQTRFLGPLIPIRPDEDDLAAAARQHNRSKSTPSLVQAGSASLK